jgi:uncharacterized LabA/DUF88 family protein/uncharacterized C2H2 Zn-finger protein
MKAVMQERCFWDIENCAIPKNLSIAQCVSLIRNALRQLAFLSGTYDIRAYCKVDELPKPKRLEFERACVDLRDVASSKPGAADMKLLQDISSFALKHKPCVIVLISGDVDFTETLVDLRSHGYRIVLFHNQMARKELLGAADVCISFDGLGSSKHHASGVAKKDAKSNGIHSCNVCKKAFRSDVAVKQHVVYVHGSKNNAVVGILGGKGGQKSQKEKGTMAKVWSCPKCKSAFKSEVSMLQHKNAKHAMILEAKKTTVVKLPQQQQVRPPPPALKVEQNRKMHVVVESQQAKKIPRQVMFNKSLEGGVSEVLCEKCGFRRYQHFSAADIALHRVMAANTEPMFCAREAFKACVVINSYNNQYGSMNINTYNSCNMNAFHIFLKVGGAVLKETLLLIGPRRWTFILKWVRFNYNNYFGSDDMRSFLIFLVDDGSGIHDPVISLENQVGKICTFGLSS